VDATYSGDSFYTPSISKAIGVPGQLLSATVTVTPSSPGITTAQSLTVTVGVNGGSGNPTPTGSVTLASGSYSSAAVTLNGDSASIDIPPGSLMAGTDMLQASYTPDSASSSTYNSSIGSGSIAVTLQALTTPTITVTPSASSIAPDQPLMVKVGVTGGSGNPTPTGFVTLMDSTTTAAGTPLIHDSFPYLSGTEINGRTTQSGNSVWVAGTNAVVEDNYLTLNTPFGTLFIANLGNTSTIEGEVQPISTVGGTLRLCGSSTEFIDPNVGSVGLFAMNGFNGNSLNLTIGPDVWVLEENLNGTATVVLQGTENLTVDCNTNYPVEMILNQVAGTVQVIPPDGVPSAVFADPSLATLNATYGMWEISNYYTNTYIGQWGSVWMGESYSSAAIALNNGSATIAVPAGFLTVGSNTLTVSYTPDAASSFTYTPATGTDPSPFTTTVSPNFAISGTAISVVPGAVTSNTSTITITPGGGFTGPVTLTAAITSTPPAAQFLPSISIGSSNTVSVTGSTAVPATLTIFTTASSSTSCTAENRMPSGILQYKGGGAALACLIILGIPARRRNWQSKLGMLLLLVAIVGGVVACGSGGGGGVPCPTTVTTGTTAGVYTITVTGTSGTLTETGTVSLTVQ
jgi:hypothetical protein